MILNFLDAYATISPVNILSLGAGYDTTVFWLHEVAGGKYAEVAKNNLTYIELDYDQVVNRKIEVIAHNQTLSSYIVGNKAADP